MIDLSVLYAGQETASAPHRYGKKLERLKPPPEEAHALARSARERRPVVVWNTTRTCNLKCVHCYSDSEAKKYPGELTTDEGYALIDDLAQYGIPALLLSGGEPLTRPDLFQLARRAHDRGVHVVLSTNGTLIDEAVAHRLRETHFSYVGVSLDGLEGTHDRFRGVKGTFQKVLRAFRHLAQVGQKAGLRLTLSRANVAELDGIFDLMEEERIRRICFYHLVPSGRGHEVATLTPRETRAAIETILRRTEDLARRGKGIEVLTVDNHADGPFLFLKLVERRDPRAQEVFDMLRWNGGGLYSSGVGIACVDFLGQVHPDQFWMHHTFGNVRERPFSQIWEDTSEPLMAGLKDRKARIEGRCASCAWLDLCGGALRVRAQLATGNPWASDPACYLTDAEIAAVPSAAAGGGRG